MPFKLTENKTKLVKQFIFDQGVEWEHRYEEIFDLWYQLKTNNGAVSTDHFDPEVQDILSKIRVFQDAHQDIYAKRDDTSKTSCGDYVPARPTLCYLYEIRERVRLGLGPEDPEDVMDVYFFRKYGKFDEDKTSPVQMWPQTAVFMENPPDAFKNWFEAKDNIWATSTDAPQLVTMTTPDQKVNRQVVVLRRMKGPRPPRYTAFEEMSKTERRLDDDDFE